MTRDPHQAGLRALARGQSAFDALAMRNSLPAWADAARPAPYLTDYRRFYDLNFTTPADHRVGWLPFGSGRLVVQCFQPAEPVGTAVVCHGYFDHVGLFGHLIDYLLARGLVVLTFDQPGHGLSSGAPATIDSFDRYVQALRTVLAEAGRELPGPWHLFGQSMGGAISLEHLFTLPNDRSGTEAGNGPSPGGRPEHIVLFAPLVRPALWPLNRWVYEIARRTVQGRPRTITNNAENPEFLALMRRDPLQAQVLPVQWVTAMVQWMRRFERYEPQDLQVKILQGEADRTVGWRYNLRVLQRLVHARILRLPAGRHHLVNESAALRRIMWSWIDVQCGWWPRSQVLPVEPVTPLDSAAEASAARTAPEP